MDLNETIKDRINTGTAMINIRTFKIGKIDDVQVELLAQYLESHENYISELDLTSNLIGLRGVKALAKILPHGKVTELALSSNSLNDETIYHLSCGLMKSRVQELHLNYNEIGDKGAESLASILHKFPIKKLMLKDNSITDAGAQALLGALPYSSITTLDLSANQISEPMLQHLSKAVASNASRIESGRAPLTYNQEPALKIFNASYDEKLIDAQRNAALDHGQGL